MTQNPTMMTEENKKWLEKKYFHIGRRIISAKALWNIFSTYLYGEFDCMIITRELLIYSPRGEQVSKILKTFADRGLLISRNTLEGTDKNGRKKGRYIYKSNKQ